MFHSRGCVASFFRMLLTNVYAQNCQIYVLEFNVLHIPVVLKSLFCALHFTHSPHTSLVFHASVLCITATHSTSHAFVHHVTVTMVRHFRIDLFHKTENGLEIVF